MHTYVYRRTSFIAQLYKHTIFGTINSCGVCVCVQMWMMRGQIEEQKQNTEGARELYNKAVSGSGPS